MEIINDVKEYVQNIDKILKKVISYFALIVALVYFVGVIILSNAYSHYGVPLLDLIDSKYFLAGFITLVTLIPILVSGAVFYRMLKMYVHISVINNVRLRKLQLRKIELFSYIIIFLTYVNIAYFFKNSIIIYLFHIISIKYILIINKYKNNIYESKIISKIFFGIYWVYTVVSILFLTYLYPETSIIVFFILIFYIRFKHDHGKNILGFIFIIVALLVAVFIIYILFYSLLSLFIDNLSIFNLTFLSLRYTFDIYIIIFITTRVVVVTPQIYDTEITSETNIEELVEYDEFFKDKKILINQITRLVLLSILFIFTKDINLTAENILVNLKPELGGTDFNVVTYYNPDKPELDGKDFLIIESGESYILYNEHTNETIQIDSGQGYIVYISPNNKKD